MTSNVTPFGDLKIGLRTGDYDRITTAAYNIRLFSVVGRFHDPGICQLYFVGPRST